MPSLMISPFQIANVSATNSQNSAPATFINNENNIMI